MSAITATCQLTSRPAISLILMVMASMPTSAENTTVTKNALLPKSTRAILETSRMTRNRTANWSAGFRENMGSSPRRFFVSSNRTP
jgi:hypothetical protein